VLVKAQDIMTPNPVSVTPETPVQEAARLMKDQNIGMLPVVRDDGSRQLVGVVTDRDIALRHVAEGHGSSDCPVKEAMTEHVTTCTPQTDLDDVMQVMGREQVRRIPIVDERGDLVGVVAQADIVLHADDEEQAERTIEEISQPFGKHTS
jgi:CBS domain-containing protein